MKYMATLIALAEDGERVTLALDLPMEAETEDDVRQRWYDEHWDARLTSASCAAVAEVRRVS